MQRRDILSLLVLAASQGLPLRRALAAGSGPSPALYQLPRPAPGSFSLFHFTDCHAQLEPGYLREPLLNLGGQGLSAGPAHLTGRALLASLALREGSELAYAISGTGFAAAAERFGRTGGFAHLATMLAQLRAERPQALLLDGGDSWQGSATALWTEGRDMIAAGRLLGVDLMTGHWEFTLGAARVQQAVREELAPTTTFLAHNVHTRDFGDAVFTPWVMREQRGVAVAIIGQAYPYTPIANPGWLIPDWTFGIAEAQLQRCVDEARAAGAAAVVLLSHNGVDIDLKLASRIRGIDLILGGHTHDPLLRPVVVASPGGQTLVTNAGSHGKFLAVADLRVRAGRLHDIDYRLLPVFSQALPADPAMQALITAAQAPFRAQLDDILALNSTLLYRRDTFASSVDQLLLAALQAEYQAEIALSPGFRWGPTLLPGHAITRGDLMQQTAIPYAQTRVRHLTGLEIKALLEDIADNLFHPDPYYQQGGDMVRVAGLHYRCAPAATIGHRIRDLTLGGEPLQPDRRYRVASWGSVQPPEAGEPPPTAAAGQPSSGGEPIWVVAERWLRAQGTVRHLPLSSPDRIHNA